MITLKRIYFMLFHNQKAKTKPSVPFIRKNFYFKFLQRFFFIRAFRKLLPFPARQRGCYILGKTGSGKSELLAQFIYNDIQSPSGCLLIDPHGDLVSQCNTFKSDYSETVYISADFAGKGLFPTYNPLQNDYHKYKNLSKRLGLISLRTEELKAAFNTIMGAEFTHSMERLISNCLPVLLHKPGGATFSDFLDFMRPDTSEALEILGQKFPSPEIAKFFQHEFRSSYFDATKQAVLTRFSNAVAANYNVSKILLAKESSFNLKKLLDAGKNVLVNLSMGALGEDGSRIIGTFLISELTTHALQRQRLPKDKRRTIFIYIDEAHNFISERMDKILSEARKYKICFGGIANQFLSQWGNAPRLKASIMANTSIKICGYASSADFKVMSQEMGMDLASIPNLRSGKFAVSISGHRPKVVQFFDFLIRKKGKKNPSYLSDEAYEKKLKKQVKKYYKRIAEEPGQTPEQSTEKPSETKIQKLL